MVSYPLDTAEQRARQRQQERLALAQATQAEVERLLDLHALNIASMLLQVVQAGKIHGLHYLLYNGDGQPQHGCFVGWLAYAAGNGPGTCLTFAQALRQRFLTPSTWVRWPEVMPGMLLIESWLVAMRPGMTPQDTAELALLEGWLTGFIRSRQARQEAASALFVTTVSK